MRHPYAEFLTKVEKPARYLGGEYQQVRKDPATRRGARLPRVPRRLRHRDVPPRHQDPLQLLNERPRIACERAFAPWVDMEAELRARGLPLVSLETARAAARVRRRRLLAAVRADVHERAHVLDLGGIPLRAARSRRGRIRWSSPAARPRRTPSRWRRSSTRSSSATARRRCRALVCEAAALQARGRAARASACPRWPRACPLYVPALYDDRDRRRDRHRSSSARRSIRACRPRPQRAMVADLNHFPFPDDAPVPYAEAIFDRMSIEIARGCTEGCRFCQAGMIYRPVRERDPE